MSTANVRRARSLSDWYSQHDPRLPAGSLDIAILVHMYHEIAQPYGLLYNLVPALKPGARIGIIDAYAPTSEHGTPPTC